MVEETSDKEENTGNSVSIPVSSNIEVLDCRRSKTSSTQSTGSIVSAPASSILETPNSSRIRSSTTPSNQKAVQLEINVQKDRHEKIVLIDNIKDPKLFTDSQEILREIKKYSDIQIDYAYQLARGGIAIHVKSIEDRDLLFQKLTPESFGGGKKHFPLVEKPSFIFVKGVDTSYHHTELVNSLLTKGLHIQSARRLLNRDTGRPTQTIKISCDSTVAEKLVKEVELSVNGKKCAFEKARSISIIRCYRCQKFGHISRNCKNSPKCVCCGGGHQGDKCDDPPKCANCSGPHPAHSSTYPTFPTYYANLTK